MKKQYVTHKKYLYYKNILSSGENQSTRNEKRKTREDEIKPKKETNEKQWEQMKHVLYPIYIYPILKSE